MSLTILNTPRRPVPFNPADVISDMSAPTRVHPNPPLSAFYVARNTWVTYFARYDKLHIARIRGCEILSAPHLRAHPKVSTMDHQVWRDTLGGAQDPKTIHARLDTIKCDVYINESLEERLETTMLLKAEAEVFQNANAAFTRQGNQNTAVDPMRAAWADAQLMESASRLDEVIDVEKRIARTVSHRVQVAYVHARFALDKLNDCPAKRENREDLCFCIAIFRHLLEDALERPPYMCLFTRFSVLRKYLYSLQRDLNQIDPKLSSPRTLLRDFTAPPLANGPEAFKAGEFMEYLGWMDA